MARRSAVHHGRRQGDTRPPARPRVPEPALRRDAAASRRRLPGRGPPHRDRQASLRRAGLPGDARLRVVPRGRAARAGTVRRPHAAGGAGRHRTFPAQALRAGIPHRVGAQPGLLPARAPVSRRRPPVRPRGHGATARRREGRPGDAVGSHPADDPGPGGRAQAGPARGRPVRVAAEYALHGPLERRPPPVLDARSPALLRFSRSTGTNTSGRGSTGWGFPAPSSIRGSTERTRCRSPRWSVSRAAADRRTRIWRRRRVSWRSIPTGVDVEVATRTLGNYADRLQLVLGDLRRVGFRGRPRVYESAAGFVAFAEGIST